jgi:hypothetical protein
MCGHPLKLWKRNGLGTVSESTLYTVFLTYKTSFDEDLKSGVYRRTDETWPGPLWGAKTCKAEGEKILKRKQPLFEHPSLSKMSKYIYFVNNDKKNWES